RSWRSRRPWPIPSSASRRGARTSMATAVTASGATATVLGVFAHVDTTVDAIEGLKAKGFRDMTVYSPVPVHEIEDVVERDRPVSGVRFFTLIGGLCGTSLGFFLTIWSALKW